MAEKKKSEAAEKKAAKKTVKAAAETASEETVSAALVKSPKGEVVKSEKKKGVVAKTDRKKAEVISSDRQSENKAVQTVEVYLQYLGKEIPAKDLETRIRALWQEKYSKKAGDFKSLKIYMKPEDNSA